MNITPDDPKWTAYVLGEATDQEREEIERVLECSEEARALVDELRIATTMLKDELAGQPEQLLLPKQRAAVRAAAGSERNGWFRARRVIWAAGLATAGILMIASLTIPSLL